MIIKYEIERTCVGDIGVLSIKEDIFEGIYPNTPTGMLDARNHLARLQPEVECPY